MSACACWANNNALGHCCFLRDDRDALGHVEKWRTDAEVCHVPDVSVAGARMAP